MAIENVMTLEITTEGLDDCDRATLQGLIVDALAGNERLARALLFRNVTRFDVVDIEPLTMSPWDGGGERVTVGFPGTREPLTPQYI